MDFSIIKAKWSAIFSLLTSWHALID